MNTQFEKIILVTRQTRLEELIARFNTKAQARFYIEHSGGILPCMNGSMRCMKRPFPTCTRLTKIEPAASYRTAVFAQLPL
jgi:hypothetical protein